MDPLRFWIDIGIVFNPTVRGITVLMKSCCLDRLADAIQKIATDTNPALSRAKSFHFCLLSDAKNLTVTPGPTSMARQGGLAYVQCYSQVKNNLDGHKRFPFPESEKFSEMLIFNSEERSQLRSGGHLSDLFHCRTSLLRNLSRVESGYGSSITCNKFRLEIRGSLALYEEMLSQLEAENWPQIDPLRLKGSRPYFIFDTEISNTYVLNRAYTIARLFQEVVSIADDLSPAQQKLARTVMKLLKSTVSTYPIERIPMLWKSEYRPKLPIANVADDLMGEQEQDVDDDEDVELPSDLIEHERKGQLTCRQLSLLT